MQFRDEVAQDGGLLVAATPTYSFGAYPLATHLFFLARMKTPTETLIFSDTYKPSNGFTFARFKADWEEEGGGVFMAHGGRTAVAFADGHAGMFTGRELNATSYNLNFWLGSTGEVENEK